MCKKFISLLLAGCLVFTNFVSGFGNIDFNFAGVDSAYAETTSDGLVYRVKDDGTLEITGYKGTSTWVNIPSKIGLKIVTSIGSMAFNNCTDLGYVSIPESIKTIDSWAFNGCTKLKSIIIPDSVEKLGVSVFLNCSSLEKVQLSNSLKSMGGTLFGNCTSLKSIIIPNSVTLLQAGTFVNCESLETISIPSSVTTISGDLFKEAPIKNFYAVKGSYAESYAKNYNVAIKPMTEEGLHYTFNSDGSAKIVKYVGADKIIEMPTKIEDKAVKTVGEGAFRGCNYITRLIVANSVETIENFAFYDCVCLTNIVIPASVTKIESTAFKDTYPTTIYGVKGSAAEVFANSRLITFNSMRDIYKLEYAVKNDGTLKIISYDGNDEKLNIPDSAFGVKITEIGDDAFSKSSLKEVKIQSNITAIGERSFENCSKLTAIEIPYSVEKIGSNAFRGCSSLASVEIPSKVKSIEYGTFSNCTSLANVSISSGVTAIRESAFSGCGNLKNVLMPNTMTSIGNQAFYRCVSLTDISIPENVKEIGMTAFEASGIKTIYGERGSYAQTYADTNGIEFKARTIDINSENITVGSISNRIYTGKGVYPSVSIKDNGTKLVKNTDYIVKYSKNKYIGTATITITGINGYSGTRTTTFKIVPRKVADVKQTDRTTGTIEMSWAAQAGSVKYQLYRATSKDGKYTRVINTQYNTYRNSGRSSGKIYYYKVRAYKIVDSEYYYGNYSDIFTASTKCKTPVVTLSTPKTKSIKVSWEKISGADGYEVRRATSKTGTYSLKKDVTSGSTISYTNTGLTKDKTYYYKIRAYKLVDGKKIYSSYSTIKSIKAI